MWPLSSSVADRQVTLEQGGTPHGTEGSHVGWAGPGPRLCTFPCDEPHAGAGLQGRADRGWGPALKTSCLSSRLLLENQM